MKTLPFISSSLLESIGLPRIAHPPDESGVLQAPDQAQVVSAVAPAPDETRRADVEEVVRDDPVRPDQSRAVQTIRPDETARSGCAGSPGHIVPLVVLSGRNVGIGE